ncbi:MAG: hypothetical protein Q7T41_02140 [Candidatus Saccharibacteria bacterium]|nr:hypothetical protein [Candidatus Saccharibacteria bacterium]
MLNLLIGREPDPTLPPVRDFKRNPGFRVNFANLAELRAAMINDDVMIIDLLAIRIAESRKVQEELLANNGMRRSFNVEHFMPIIVAEARKRHPYKKDLPGVIDRVYPFISTKDSAFQSTDLEIIDGIASRLDKAKQAVVFKRDREEGLAPETQRTNIERAVSVAEQRHPDEPVLPEYVGRIYGAMVPAMVAVQQTLFPNTYLLDDWDGTNFMPLLVS